MISIKPDNINDFFSIFSPKNKYSYIALSLINDYFLYINKSYQLDNDLFLRPLTYKEYVNFNTIFQLDETDQIVKVSKSLFKYII